MENTSWPIMEHFYTIQGEGAHQGCAAYFVRLGGCDVGCHWCDVKDSWDASQWPAMTASEITKQITKSNAPITIITGGEPAMYDLSVLTTCLHEVGQKTHIETSGAYPVKGDFDWITFSPKKFKKPDESIYPIAHELKVVIFNKSDFKWAEEHASKVNSNCKLFLQPEWSKKEEILPLIIEYVKKYPKWEISIQAHKYINVP